MSDNKASQASYSAILVCGDTDRMAVVMQSLQRRGISYDLVGDTAAAIRLFRKQASDFAFICGELADGSGIKAIQRLKKRHPVLLSVLVGPQLPLAGKKALLAEGADDYVEQEADPSAVDAVVHGLIARKDTGIISRNEKMLQIVDIVDTIAPTKVTVLITGESGTGKELIARAIHRKSDRAARPFIAVNCGALPEGVLESELFGHEKGAFTGATAQRKGRFEIADGGTLLLDEVGEMPPGTQVKLLRVLEEESFLRVGGTAKVNVNVRVIAATNRDLKALVDQGSFRKDLYYRLEVVPIHVPPLRQRREDIRTLFYTLAEEAGRKNNLEFGGITEDAMHALEAYDWPGNVRELKNLVESLIVLSHGRKISLDDLPDHIVRVDEASRELPVRVGRPRQEVERDLLFGRLALIEKQIEVLTGLILDMRQRGHDGDAFPKGASAIPGETSWAQVVDEPGEVSAKPGSRIKDVEKALIRQTLEHVNGNRKKAARVLGIGERTLYRRMKEYNLR